MRLIIDRSPVIQPFADRPMMAECSADHADESFALYDAEKQVMSNQIKGVTGGPNGTVKQVAYPDIITGGPVFTFNPFFPDQHIIGSQVKEVTFDQRLTPHAVPYLDPNTDKPVSTFEPLFFPVGKNVDISV